MIIKINNQIKINSTDLPGNIFQELQERLTFQNPKYLENENFGRWNGKTPEYLCFLENDGTVIGFPRGFIRQLFSILNYHNVIFEVEDNTRFMPDIDFTFSVALHDYQAEAVLKIMPRRYGVLQAPTGSGKTVITLAVIAQRKQPALIIVHSKELLYQWQDRINQFLDIPKEKIGLIGDGHKIIGKKLTIALAQSLKKCADEVKNKIGFVVVDECHRTPSTTFTEAITAFDCAYMLGLSATPYRRDGLVKLIYLYIGDKCHEVSSQNLQQKNQIMTATLQVRHTDFTFFYDDNYSAMITGLTNNYARNELIVDDI